MPAASVKSSDEKGLAAEPMMTNNAITQTDPAAIVESSREDEKHTNPKAEDNVVSDLDQTNQREATPSSNTCTPRTSLALLDREEKMRDSALKSKLKQHQRQSTAPTTDRFSSSLLSQHQPGAFRVLDELSDEYNPDSFRHVSANTNTTTATTATIMPLVDVEAQYVATATVVTDDSDMSSQEHGVKKHSHAEPQKIYEASVLHGHFMVTSRKLAWACCVLVVMAVAIGVSLGLVMSRKSSMTTTTSSNNSTMMQQDKDPLAWTLNSSIPALAHSFPYHTLRLIHNETDFDINNKDWYKDPQWVDIQFQPSSSQAQAWKWLVMDPDSVSQLSLPDLRTRYVMAALFFDTNGASWTNKAFWLDRQAHVCQWYSSARDASSQEIPELEGNYESKCYENGLTQLVLRNNGLVGTIPCELGLMTQLKYLSLTENPSIIKRLPKILSNLTNLEVLNVTANALTGTVPWEVGNMTKLTHFLASGNPQMLGPLPESMTNMTQLAALAIDFESMDEPDDDDQATTLFGSSWLDNLVPYWPKLSSLELSVNTRSPPVTFYSFPSVASVWADKLTTLSLSNVQLSSSTTFPSEVGLLTNLTKLVLANGDMIGALPSALQLLTGLQHLDVSRNRLSGSLAVNGDLGPWRDLRHFDVSNNALSGTVPTSIGLWSNVRYIALGDNQLNGTVPTEIGSLMNLESMSLMGNSFQGTIPSQVGSLSKLTLLDLRNTPGLTGSVPSELCALAAMRRARPNEADLEIWVDCDAALQCETDCCMCS